MKEIKLNLVENALSFASEAIVKAVLAEEKEHEWKFAILHMVQAIELSLKELLRMQHPVLIYRNVEAQTNTVSLHEALSRLHKIAGFQPTSDESDAIKLASGLRNQIVHHEFSAKTVELKPAFAKLFGFLSDFHRNHLDEAMEEHIDKVLWQKGVAIKDYGEEIFRRAQSRMETDGVDEDCMVACPKCGWEALTAFGENQDQCYVCGNTEFLVVCERCQKIMFFGEHEEYGKKNFCWDCLCYLTDDYWYESAREREHTP